MSEAVRPFRLPGATTLEQLRSPTMAVLDVWAAHWIEERESDVGATLQIESLEAAEAREEGAYSLWRGEFGRIWFSESTDQNALLGSSIAGATLFPHGAPVDDWIAGALISARNARNRALCGVLMGACAADAYPRLVPTLPAELFAPGSGALRMTCRQYGLDAVMEAGAWMRLPPQDRIAATTRLPGVKPLDLAASDAIVRLNVLLEGADVDALTLFDLREGDVLRLSHKLEEGVIVACGGARLARALLGERQGKRSVQVLADH